MKSARLLSVILFGAACAGTAAHADVTESINYVYYDAPVASGQSLLSALNGASSIRQNGKTYHGYTKWHVRWNFWWQETGSSCRITRVKTTVTSTVTLPRIVGGTAAQKREFERFSAALKEHELGHAAIGKEAADAVDSEIRSLAQKRNCSELEHAANSKGNEVIREFQEKEKRYDAETKHGREQGAWLER